MTQHSRTMSSLWQVRDEREGCLELDHLPVSVRNHAKALHAPPPPLIAGDVADSYTATMHTLKILKSKFLRLLCVLAWDRELSGPKGNAWENPAPFCMLISMNQSERMNTHVPQRLQPTLQSWSIELASSKHSLTLHYTPGCSTALATMNAGCCATSSSRTA